MTHLSLTDLMFLRGHKPGTGPAAVIQLMMTFDEKIDEATLLTLHSRLANSSWSRQVHRSRIPLARPRWVHAAESLPLTIDPSPIPRDETQHWFNREGQRSVNPEEGHAWRIAVGYTADGGTCVSFISSHAHSDGLSLDVALGQALAFDSELPALRDDGISVDVVDALAQARELLPALWQELRALRDPSRRSAIARGIRRALASPPPETPLTEYCTRIQVSYAEWERVAVSHGGTANSLFLAVEANLLRSLLDIPEDRNAYLTTALLHKPDLANPAANSFSHVLIPVAAADSNYGDLTTVRATAKAAFSAAPPRSSGGRSRPLGMVPALVYVLPSRFLSALDSTATTRVAVNSSMGTLPQNMGYFGRYPVATATSRALHQGVTVERGNRLPHVMYMWYRRHRDNISLAVQSTLPDIVVNDDALAHALLTELRKWGLEGERL